MCAVHQEPSILNRKFADFHESIFGVAQCHGLKHHISMVHQRLFLKTSNQTVKRFFNWLAVEKLTRITVADLEGGPETVRPPPLQAMDWHSHSRSC